MSSLTNFMVPEIRQMMARQGRGINEESFPAKYSVEDQASMVDDKPVHNNGVERQYGEIDYILQKMRNLKAVSRSITLQRVEHLITGVSYSGKCSN